MLPQSPSLTFPSHPQAQGQCFFIGLSCFIIIIIIIIIIKKDWQSKAGRGRLPPYQSEDPSPTLPTYRGKEEKGKIVKDKKVESN